MNPTEIFQFFLAICTQIQDEGEDDWWLPEWVKQSLFSGYYSCSRGPLNDNAEVQLAWKDFEPQDGVFDWSPLESALKTGRHGIWVRFYASGTARTHGARCANTAARSMTVGSPAAGTPT